MRDQEAAQAQAQARRNREAAQARREQAMRDQAMSDLVKMIEQDNTELVMAKGINTVFMFIESTDKKLIDIFSRPWTPRSTIKSKIQAKKKKINEFISKSFYSFELTFNNRGGTRFGFNYLEDCNIVSRVHVDGQASSLGVQPGDFIGKLNELNQNEYTIEFYRRKQAQATPSIPGTVSPIPGTVSAIPETESAPPTSESEKTIRLTRKNSSTPWGIGFSNESGRYKITHVQQKSLANSAGLGNERGSSIIKVNGVDVSDISHDKFLKLIRDSSLTLVLVLKPPSIPGKAKHPSRAPPSIPGKAKHPSRAPTSIPGKAKHPSRAPPSIPDTPQHAGAWEYLCKTNPSTSTGGAKKKIKTIKKKLSIKKLKPKKVVKTIKKKLSVKKLKPKTVKKKPTKKLSVKKVNPKKVVKTIKKKLSVKKLKPKKVKKETNKEIIC